MMSTSTNCDARINIQIVVTNQRPVSRSRDHSRPIRGLSKHSGCRDMNQRMLKQNKPLQFPIIFVCDEVRCVFPMVKIIKMHLHFGPLERALGAII